MITLKRSDAFSESRNNKTALIITDPGLLLGAFFCVHVQHDQGANRLHIVNLHSSLKDAMSDAEHFLTTPTPKET